MSETAVIHTACACPNTRHLDLEGSVDLAQDTPGGRFWGAIR